jgi:hypothetical protein
MPTVYTLHLSRHVKGMTKGPVRAAPATGVVFDFCEETGAAISPCRASVRACLPACYRKAFDRSLRLSQFSGKRGVHIALYGSRGRYLNTIYAVPYTFTP